MQIYKIQCISGKNGVFPCVNYKEADISISPNIMALVSVIKANRKSF